MRLLRGARTGLLGGLMVMLTVAGLDARDAAAQQIDLSHGGPISITSSGGIEWLQQQQEVIATGDAKAIRANVTVTADRLIAWYRKKSGGANTAAAPAAPATGLAADSDTGGNEVFRVQAEGHVHIYTQTDQVWGDKATYDLDQAVLVVTGQHLKLATPNDVLTARDDLEYWSQRHMAVARGDAVVVTNDGRRLQGDTLVAYTSDTATAPQSPPAAAKVADKPAPSGGDQDPLASAGKLQKVEVFGHVIVRTVTDTVTGDRAVYVPDTGIARLAGQVRITRGQNQLNGSEAEVNMKTGVSRLLAGNAGRVQGLVLPNDQTNQALAGPGAQPGATPAKPQTERKEPPGGKQP